MKIYYYENTVQISLELFNLYLNKLPFHWKEKIISYRRWQDRQASLYGKLLLVEGLKNIGIYLNNHIEFQFSDNNRPSLPDLGIDFNISHTQGIVVCAISEEYKVGIDIEMIREVGLNYFTETMTLTQWKEINSEPDRYSTFFKYWAIKESVLKVDGRGITLPLDIMEVHDDSIQLDSGKWYVTSLDIKEGFMAYIATEIKDILYEVVPVLLFESVSEI